jgi:hypothetical protein
LGFAWKPENPQKKSANGKVAFKLANKKWWIFKIWWLPVWTAMFLDNRRVSDVILYPPAFKKKTLLRDPQAKRPPQPMRKYPFW